MILDAAPLVQGSYSDQARARQNNDSLLELAAIRENTTPRVISHIARETAEGVIPEKTPSFRGVYYKSGLPDGTINGDKMNLNDWVFFAKGGTGGWQEQYVYQWTSTGWEIRPRPSQDPTYGWLYLDAVSSAGSGSPVGTFSDVFCEALTTNTAFIKYLFMQQATIRENGYIRSAETDANGNPLLLINKNGLNAINAKVKNGIFENMTVTGLLSANIDLVGFGAMPLVGAVREYINFKFSNNTISDVEKSDGIEEIHYKSTGLFEITFKYGVFSTIAERMTVSGYASESNGAALSVIKKYGGYRYTPSGIGRAYMEIETHSPYGQMLNPYYMSILILG
jgi:hypothetical protein